MLEANDGYAFSHVVQFGVRENTRAEPPTLSEYLALRFPHSTSDVWRGRILAGEVVVDNCTVHHDLPARKGSCVIWNRPGWVEAEAPCRFDILFEDDVLIAVNKPSGLPTLPGGGFYRHTLLHLVEQYAGEVYPLHRLGRATSGIVLFAKSKQDVAALSQGWAVFEKQYLALACGVMPLPIYDIEAAIGPVQHPRLGTVHAAKGDGKSARSIARVVKRRVDSTLVEVDLITGRPHQIRIHLAYIGHPLVGDGLYAEGGIPRKINPGLPGDSGYLLHAKRLAILHPRDGNRMVFLAPEPIALSAESSPSMSDPSMSEKRTDLL